MDVWSISLTQVKSFKFVFYSNFLLILFDNTHSLVNLLQSKYLDILKAIQFSEITCSNLISIRNDMDSSGAFNALYEKSSINIPENNGKKRRQNCTTTNTKELLGIPMIKLLKFLSEKFKKDSKHLI